MHIMMESIKCCKLYVIFYMTCILTSVVLGIPLKSNDEIFISDKITNAMNYNGGDGGIDVADDNQLTDGVYAADNNRLQADGIDLEDPTVRIKVTVTKRSRRFWEPWELNRDICPPSICTANDEKQVRGTAGTVFYNGDIILDNESEKIIYGNSLRMRYKRATMRSSRTWRNGTVPYMFASDIAPKSKSVIRKALRTIEKQTCIRFRRRKLRNEDYVRFISEPGCWSSVGRVGGEQKVSIGLGCERLGTAIHEISHVLGFWHEQARPDRDDYVNIIEESISPRYLPDFTKANKTLVTSRGFPYDYESVMHYSKKAFTNLGDDTIKVIGIGKKLKMRIGQRDALSNIDIAQLRDMYKCNDKEDEKVTSCPNHWKKIGRSCYRFEAKQSEQFSGAVKKCDDFNSRLLFIDDATEDKYIKRYIKKKYPDVKVWRTGGRVINGTFVWYTETKQVDMKYTNWKKRHPASFSSMALVYNKKKDRVRWEGVWLGSYSQLPEHAYAFICERRARRKCIPGEFPDGHDYRGTLDHTIDGYTCQKWSSHYPWAHTLLPYPYNGDANDKDGLGDHNYCRNPSGDRKSRPWCYTTKSKYKWQYCDVSICLKKDAAFEQKKAGSKKANSGNGENIKPYQNDRNATERKKLNKKQNNSGPTRRQNNEQVTNGKLENSTEKRASSINNPNKKNDRKDINRKHDQKSNKKNSSSKVKKPNRKSDRRKGSRESSRESSKRKGSSRRV